MKTLNNNKLFTALMLVCLSLATMNLFAQKKTLRTEDDGFQWYELEQNGKFGAQSKSGTTFIPLSRGYTFICYHDGWFRVDKGKKWNGACDKNGREIIAPGKYDFVCLHERDGYYKVELHGKEGACDKDGREIIAPEKYDDVCLLESDGYYYYEVKLHGKKGACDMNGREIVAPKYESLICNHGVFKYENASGKWVSTGISLPKGISTNYASNTTTTTTTTTSGGSGSSGSSSGSGKAELLYKGDYTAGPQVYPDGSSYSDVLGDTRYVEIYSDWLELHPGSYSFKNITNNGARRYEAPGGYVLVYKNFNLKKFTYAGNMGVITQEFTKEGSSSTMPQNQGGHYGGGGNNPKQTPTPTPTPQPKQHQCGLCKGSGRTIKTDGTSFGKTKYCSECGKTVPDYHYHSPCESCGGKGWW